MKLLLCALLGLAAARLSAADDYKLGPDSLRQVGVPGGEVIKMPPWTNSAIFPGTFREWWIYVPKQYDGSTAANLMVFQDGASYANTNGQYRVPVVFDNLIAKKEMPVTIGVFINPGIFRAPHTHEQQKEKELWLTNTATSRST